MANGENVNSQEKNLNNEASTNEEAQNQNINNQNEPNPEEPKTGEKPEGTSDQEEPKQEEAPQSKEKESLDTPPEKSQETVEEPKEESKEPAQSEEKPSEEKETAGKENASKEETKAKPKEEDPSKFDELFAELKEKKENNETITVHVIKRIRGGLRVEHKDMPMFLPASHFTLKRNPSEEEIRDVLGQDLEVHVHELSEEAETKRKTVIVTRKHILEEEFWGKLTVGERVEGVVSSIAPFGVFLDLGGIEGLIHISRLSQSHIDHPKDIVKKGEKLKAIVVDLNREKQRIALSTKELEDSPWEDVEDDFPKGTSHKGIVKRLTDFGAYVELKPGVDGLLRTNEISWTKRIRKPADVLSVGDEIEVEVLNSSAAKRTASLSLKRTQENPWPKLKEEYPIGTKLKATVKQIMPQGVVLSLNEDVDGFMPRSKMKDIIKGKKIPLNPGQEIEITIADLVPDKESLIFAPVIDESLKEELKQQDRRKSQKPKATEEGAFTFQDLLSDHERSEIFKATK
mgnify:CR=1 FL=1